MGTTYSNCQVRTDSQEAVVAALTGLLKEPAYVAPAVNGWVGVYPEGDGEAAETLAKKLSAKLSCGVFYWSVYDSDIFFYTLYENGKKRDEFDSSPDYFETVSSAKKARLRGKPEILMPYYAPGTMLAAIQAVLHPMTAAEEAKKLIKFSPVSADMYLFAEEQATALAALLDINEELANADYSCIEEGELEDLTEEEFRLVGNENLSQEYKNEKLWYAVYLEDLKSAVTMGADVNARNNSGVPVLVKLANYCAVERMQFLISKGADVSAATSGTDPRNVGILLPWNGGEDGFTPLMAAAGASKEHPPYPAEAVQVLLDTGADVNARSETGRTALSEALLMTDWTKHQGKISRIAPEDVLRAAAARSAQVVEILRAAGATE